MRYLDCFSAYGPFKANKQQFKANMSGKHVKGVQLSVMPASSKRVAKEKEQGYNLSELLPYAQKLITEGGPTGKNMVEEAFDYYTKRAGTAPFLTIEEQSANKWN